jgi:predicted enzyme related to lactoylglutathione lyase
MATKRTGKAVPAKTSRVKAKAKAKPTPKKIATKASTKAPTKAAANGLPDPRRRKAHAKSEGAQKARAKSKALAKPASRGAAKSNAMFQKVAFTMFSVVDPIRARAFYEGTLGFTRGLSSPDGVWTEYDLPGGGCLALFCHPNPDFAVKPGGASIAFEVTDLDALNQRLKAAGVSYQGDVVHGPNCRMSNIVDSEGNGIILHQLN